MDNTQPISSSHQERSCLRLGRLVAGVGLAAVPLIVAFASPLFKEVIAQMDPKLKIASLGALASTPIGSVLLLSTMHTSSLIIDSDKAVTAATAQSAVFQKQCPALTSTLDEYIKAADRHPTIVIHAKQDPLQDPLKDTPPAIENKQLVGYTLDEGFVKDFPRSYKGWVGNHFLPAQPTLFSKIMAKLSSKEPLEQKMEQFIALGNRLIPQSDLAHQLGPDGKTPVWATEASRYLNQKAQAVGLEMVSAYYSNTEFIATHLMGQQAYTYSINYTPQGVVYEAQMEYVLRYNLEVVATIDTHMIYCPKTSDLTVVFSSPKWFKDPKKI
jgi:hypothetical protein